MNSIYESIMRGLNDILEYERGDKTKAYVVEYGEEECVKIIAEREMQGKGQGDNV